MVNGPDGSDWEPDWAVLADAREPGAHDADADETAIAALAADGTAADETATDETATDETAADELASDGPAADLRMSLEAVLLVADEPVTEEQLADVTEHPAATVAAALRALAESYTAEQRGFDLREVAGGWRLYTRAECAAVVERFVSEAQEIRLTQAALETLAVVAYRQPVSRARVSAVRGVNCDGVVRTLVLRGLIEEAGSDPETGAILFRTTSYFLERLGLARLSDLPDLVPFLPDHLDDELEAGHGVA